MSQKSFIDYYALLELSPKASEEDIKKAYLEKIKDVHPDKFVDKSEEEKETALKLSKLINQAKGILLDPKEREYYDLEYRHYMSEAAAKASQLGFSGGNYNDYVANAGDILQAREMKLSKEHGKYKYIILVAAIVMGSLSLIWRFCSPKDVSRFVTEKEVPVTQEVLYQVALSSKPTAFALNDNGNLLTVGTKNSTIELWQVEGDSLLQQRQIQMDEPAQCLFLSGELIYAGTNSGAIKVYSISSGELKKTAQAHQGQVTAIRAQPSQDILASAGLDKTIKIWELSTLSPKQTLMGNAFPIHDFRFVEDGKYVIYPEDRFMKSWNWQENTKKQITYQQKSITAMDFNNGWIAMSGKEMVLKQIQRSTNSVRESLPDKALCTTLAYFPSGEVIASGAEDGRIRIYGTQSARKLNVIAAHDSAISWIGFLPQTNNLISIGEDQKIKIWPFSLESL